MVTLNNPNAPATKRQLWLLHILTKEDTRDWNLTMQQASDKINELKNGGGNTPPDGKTDDMHYCVMFSTPPSRHRMSNGRPKWRALYTTKDRRLAIKRYNGELERMQRYPGLYPTSQVVLIECRAALFARTMLLAGLTEYRGRQSGKLYARIIKDSRG